MGRGIAVAFKSIFGGLPLLAQQIGNGCGIGSTLYLQDKKRYVFYLVTKDKAWHKPSYENLFRSIQDMVVKVV